MINLFILIISFTALIKGADLLIEGAASFSKKMNIPNIAIGLSLVAFGTSAPELTVNIVASIEKSSGIILGNILGSNIANIFLVLGIASIIKTIPVSGETVKKQIPFALLASFILMFFFYLKQINRTGGIILLFMFVVFIVYILTIKPEELDVIPEKKFSYTKDFILIILGITGLILGGRFVVVSAVNIAQYFNISHTFIGLSIIALGTSMPELITCVIAALKNKFDIAIGNIIGSNIFNSFLVLGVSSTIYPVNITEGDLFNFIINIAAVFLLLIFMFTGIKRNLLERWEGIIFIIIFFSYLTYNYTII
ncbi:MAG: calcium/sodium antiporter [Candidatus Muiribacteriota bacterium]